MAEQKSVKRKPLTYRQLLVLWQRQSFTCAAKGCLTALIIGDEGQHVNFIDEHIQPLSLGGTNEITNRKLLCIPCAKRKTFHPRSLATTLGGDNFEAKKANRIARGGKVVRRPMRAGSRKIPSRPW